MGVTYSKDTPGAYTIPEPSLNNTITLQVPTDFDPLNAGTCFVAQYENINDWIWFLTQSGIFPYGNGEDGDLVIDNESVVLTQDKFYNNVTIQNIGRLSVDGYRVYINGTLSIELGSEISARGFSASGITGGSSVNDTGTLGNGSRGGRGGAVLSDGYDGYDTSTDQVGIDDTTLSGGNYAAGGNGGSSVTNTSGDGGQIVSWDTVYGRVWGYDPALFGAITTPQLTSTGQSVWAICGGSGGGGGAGNAAFTGGGGGGGGGLVAVAARNIVLGDIANIFTGGGVGANSSAGGGGGGGGGTVMIVYSTITLPPANVIADMTPSALCPGGEGGTGGGAGNLDGVNGADGNVVLIQR